jgi:hypothetical protein
MPASAEVVRLLERDSDACGAPRESIQSLIEVMESDEVVHWVGTGICGIRMDDGLPVLYLITSRGIRTIDLVGFGEAPQTIARSQITGQDSTPVDANRALAECYGAGGRIIFRLWFQDRSNDSALDQMEAFSTAVELIGIANPR